MIATFYLQEESIYSSHSTSLTIRRSQSFISLIDSSSPSIPAPARPKENLTEDRSTSTRVAERIHRFETRLIPTKSSQIKKNDVFKITYI